MNYKIIGVIGNYYGGLCIAQQKDKYYWGIENYDGFLWEEIPESLYNQLVKFESERSGLASKERYSKTVDERL